MSYGKHVEEMSQLVGCLFWLIVGTLILAGAAIFFLGIDITTN